MRAEYIYPFGGWGLVQFAKLLMVGLTVVAVGGLLQGRASAEGVAVGMPGAFVLAQWGFYLTRWSIRAGRRTARIVRWIAARV